MKNTVLSILFLFSILYIHTSQASAFPVKKNKPPISNHEDTKNTDTPILKQDNQSANQQTDKVPDNQSSVINNPKSQLVALLLAFFVGFIGVHRFYLGYTTQGVLQLLTGGLCGIWTLIDLVRIAIGDLQPKKGPYDKPL